VIIRVLDLTAIKVQYRKQKPSPVPSCISVYYNSGKGSLSGDAACPSVCL